MSFFDKHLFDDTTRERLARAEKLAREESHPQVDFQHLLWVDVESEGSALREALDDERRFRELKDGLARLLARMPAGPSGGTMGYSKELCDIADAFAERDAGGDAHNLGVAVEALARRAGRGEPAGWTELLAAVTDYRPHPIVTMVATDFGLGSSLLLPSERASADGAPTPAALASAREMLSQFTVDLTAQAREGKIGETIGRQHEIRQLVKVLARKESNNPILLGEAGVGKTKIVEGLAARIASGEVHPRVRDKRVLSLDMGLLVAGAQYRGQFEDRLKAILRAMKEAGGDIILFVDEIHQLLGLGKTSGPMDAANLMKPALARGELWCVGATTYDEYRHVESDPALRRRFQPVHVPEQSLEEVEEILRRVRPAYEAHHGVRYSDESLRALGRMARRYIGEVRSPAREVGLLDELGAALSLSVEETDAAKDPVVAEEHVAEAISERTGIPVQRMSADRRERALRLEESLGKRVFGQDQVIGSVGRIMRRSLAGLSSPGQPRAVFFFAGPSGVGKTELAKAMADELFDSPDAVVRLDMSEFNAETARNRLIGSDPGFVGYEEGGRLAEAVRRRPYSLVLLDEFEKAHPSVWRLFLQVFDEGRLTDSKGRTINFCETVIVMTSNAGAMLMNRVRQLHRDLDELLADRGGSEAAASLRPAADRLVDLGARAVTGMEALAYQILRDEADRRLSGDEAPPDEQELNRRAILAIPGFPPELFGRIGRALVFNELGTEHLEHIFDHQMLGLCHRVAAERGLDCPPTRAAAVDWLAREDDSEGTVTYACRAPGAPQPVAAIRMSADHRRRCVERGFDPLVGARALRSLIREELESVIAEQILKHDPAGPVGLELSGAAS